ncbi:lysis system i-spanin subunit Rz [Maricaulis maris]|uniref:lysis system i-spanin subunit Rz n=1 Tax=Maricaulis maris TaxID=74318 RepID=UPI003A8D08CD
MRLYLLIGAALLAIFVAVWLRLDYLDGERNRLADELDVSQQGVTLLQETVRLTEETFAQRDRFDDKTTKELKVLRDENKRLANCVATGNCRLLVNASCPRVSADTSAGRVDDGGAELAADARQPYFAHREQVTLDEAKLRGLQAYVRLFCRRPALD